MADSQLLQQSLYLTLPHSWTVPHGKSDATSAVTSHTVVSFEPRSRAPPWFCNLEWVPWIEMQKYDRSGFRWYIGTEDFLEKSLKRKTIFVPGFNFSSTSFPSADGGGFDCCLFVLFGATLQTSLSARSRPQTPVCSSSRSNCFSWSGVFLNEDRFNIANSRNWMPKPMGDNRSTSTAATVMSSCLLICWWL